MISNEYFTEFEKQEILKVYWVLANKYSNSQNVLEYEENNLQEFIIHILMQSQENGQIIQSAKMIKDIGIKLGLKFKNSDNTAFIKPSIFIQQAQNLCKGIDSESVTIKQIVTSNQNTRKFLIQSTLLIFLRIIDNIETKINQIITDETCKYFSIDRIPIQYLEQLYLMDNNQKLLYVQKSIDLSMQVQNMNILLNLQNIDDLIYLKQALQCIGLSPSFFYLQYLFNLYKQIIYWFVESDVIQQLINIINDPEFQENELYILTSIQIMKYFLTIVRQEMQLLENNLFQKDIINKESVHFKKAIKDVYQFQPHLVYLLTWTNYNTLKGEVCIILAIMIENCEQLQQSRSEFYRIYSDLITLQFPSLNNYCQALSYLFVNLSSVMQKYDLQLPFYKQPLAALHFFLPMIELIKSQLQIETHNSIICNHIISLQNFLQFIDDETKINEIFQIIILNLFKSQIQQKYILRMMICILQTNNQKLSYLILSNTALKDFIIKQLYQKNINYDDQLCLQLLSSELSVLITQKYFMNLKSLPSHFLKELILNLNNQITTQEFARQNLSKICEFCIKEFDLQQLQQLQIEGQFKFVEILVQILQNCEEKDQLIYKNLGEEKIFNFEIYQQSILSLNEFFMKGIKISGNSIQNKLLLEFNIQNLQNLKIGLSKILIHYKDKTHWNQQELYCIKQNHPHKILSNENQEFTKVENSEFWKIILDFLFYLKESFKIIDNDKIWDLISEIYYNYTCKLYGYDLYQKSEIRVPVILYRRVNGQELPNPQNLFKMLASSSYIDFKNKLLEYLIKINEINNKNINIQIDCVTEIQINNWNTVILDEKTYQKLLDQTLKKSGQFNSFSSFVINYKITQQYSNNCSLCRMPIQPFIDVNGNEIISDDNICLNCMTQSRRQQNQYQQGYMQPIQPPPYMYQMQPQPQYNMMDQGMMQGNYMQYGHPHVSQQYSTVQYHNDLQRSNNHTVNRNNRPSEKNISPIKRREDN